MATQKRLNARIIPKHDIEVNWNKAINFIPLKGELIVYDADENYSYPRIKQGDGVTQVTQLPFVTDYLPHTSIEEVNYTRLPYKSNPFCEVIPGPEGSGYVMVKGKRLGLVEGETYQVECYEYFTDDGIRLESPTDFFEADVLVTSEGDWLAHADYIVPPAGILWLTDWNYFDILDGVIFNDDGELVEGEGYVYFIGGAAHSFGNIETVIYNIPSTDYVYHKIDGNLLPTSQSFDGDSLLPQSGQAVAAAMQTAINRSRPNITQTLGDGHIKAQYDSKALKTYLYTDGIGLNENLKTDNKDTLVDAINEIQQDAINKISGKNLVTYTYDNQVALYKVSDSNEIVPVSAKYDFPSINNAKLYIPVYDGLVEWCVSYDNKEQWAWHINKNGVRDTRLVYTSSGVIAAQSVDEFKKAKKRVIIALQNLETKKYVINLFLFNEDNSFIQYNIGSNGSSIKRRVVTDTNYLVLSYIQNQPILDSSGQWYSEQRYVTPLVHNNFAFTIDEEGFIVKDIENTVLKPIDNAGAGSSAIWSTDSFGFLTELSTNGKMYYTKLARDSQRTIEYPLIDINGNIIVPNCVNTRIDSYKGYLAVLTTSNNVYYLTLVDTTTNSIKKQIPLSISTNYNAFFIHNNHIYLYYNSANTYISYVGAINNSYIDLRYSVDEYKNGFSRIIKPIGEHIVAVPTQSSDRISCLLLKKSLKFSESDSIKSVEELDKCVTKNYSDSAILIDDISVIEHAIKVKVTSKNLIDISKIPATPESTALNYFSEVGEDYVVVTSTEGYTGNGYATTNLKLKDLCPQLEIGKSYIINAEASSYHQMIHLGIPSEVSWYFGKSLTMTENILNSPVHFYGLSAYNEQGTGECRISNIQVYEADKIVTEYSPYVDVTSLNVTVKGKNLINVDSAMLNYSISHGSAVGTEFNSSTAIRTGEGYVVFDKISILPNTTYTISLDNTNFWLDRMFELDLDSLVTKHHSMYGSNVDEPKYTITTKENTACIVIRLRKKDNTTVIAEELANINLQMELNSQQTEYEPYFYETYSPDTYGNINVLYRPYTAYIDINNDKVNMSVSYNKKLDGIYSDIQKLQAQQTVNTSLLEILDQGHQKVSEAIEFNKTVTGDIIQLNDISSVEHNIKVKVDCGRNLFNINKLESTAGITNNGDGSITVKHAGTTDNTLKELAPALEVGKTYIMSASTEAADKCIYIRNTSTYIQFNEAFVLTEEIFNSKISFYASYSVTNDPEATDIIYNIQIEEGISASEYEPYIDPTLITVVGCTKNLFDEAWEVGQLNTSTGEESSNSNSIRSVNYTTVRPETTYTVSLPSGNNYYLIEYDRDFNFAFYGGLKTGTFTFTTSPSTAYLKLMQFGNTTIPANVQIELGSMATDYVPHTSNSAVLNVKGICSIKSISPSMQIFANIADRAIECEYNKDNYDRVLNFAINKAIKESNGIKYITSEVKFSELDYGVYVVLGEKGGKVDFEDGYFATNTNVLADFIVEGTITITSAFESETTRLVNVRTVDAGWMPAMFDIFYDVETGFDYTSLITYTPKTYVDEQIASLQTQIDQLTSAISGVSKLLGGDE